VHPPAKKSSDGKAFRGTDPIREYSHQSELPKTPFFVHSKVTSRQRWDCFRFADLPGVERFHGYVKTAGVIVVL
jgi:hypothetical protein